MKDEKQRNCAHWEIGSDNCKHDMLPSRCPYGYDEDSCPHYKSRDEETDENVKKLEKAKELIHGVGVDIPLLEAEVETRSVEQRIAKLIQSYQEHWYRFSDMKNPKGLSKEEIREEFEKLKEKEDTAKEKDAKNEEDEKRSCPECGSKDWQIVPDNSGYYGDAGRRKHHCNECDHEWKGGLI